MYIRAGNSVATSVDIKGLSSIGRSIAMGGTSPLNLPTDHFGVKNVP
jgi:hypothetical protein